MNVCTECMHRMYAHKISEREGINMIQQLG